MTPEPAVTSESTKVEPQKSISERDPAIVLADIELLLSSDTLGENGRKARRNALIWAAISVLVVKAGFVPTEVVALGIKFTAIQQQWLVASLGVLVLWSMLEFRVHDRYGMSVRSFEHAKLYLELQNSRRAWKDHGPFGPNLVVAAEKGMIGGNMAMEAMHSFGFRALVEIFGTYAASIFALACIVWRSFH